MKKLLLSIAVLVMIMSCDTGKTYTIKGKITGNSENLASGMVYLSNLDKNDPIMDSVKMVNGEFVFKGNVQTPALYNLSVSGIDGKVTLFLENTQFTVNGTDSAFTDAEVSGGAAQNMRNQFMEMKQKLLKEYDIMKLSMELREINTTDERKEEIYKIIDEYQTKFNEELDAMVAQDPISVFALDILAGKISDLPLDSVEYLVNEYNKKPEFEGNKTLLKIEEELAKEKALQPGQPCKDFTLKNPEGKEITFSEIYPKHKITMIDFWAGWCSPCRQFNPKLVEIYKKYHENGFEIVGVSLDKDRNQWEGAIKDDNLTWIQVSSVNHWQCPVAQMYNVRFIPQNIFVDSEGIIVGHRLGEEEIDSLLKEKL